MSKQKTAPTTDTIVVSHNKFVLAIVITLILGLAAGAFVLSFDALLALALASAINSSIAWIWPLIIDGFIVTATIAVFALRGRDAKSTWYPWAALVLFAFVSVFGNSLHAVDNQDILGVDVWIASCVSAAPAVALLIASHFLVIMISAPKHVTEQQVIVTDTAGHNLGTSTISAPFTEPHIEHRVTPAPSSATPEPVAYPPVNFGDDAELSKKNFKSEVTPTIVEPVVQLEPVSLVLPARVETPKVGVVEPATPIVQQPVGQLPTVTATEPTPPTVQAPEPISEVIVDITPPVVIKKKEAVTEPSTVNLEVEDETSNIDPATPEAVTPIKETPVRKTTRKTVAKKKADDNVLVVNEKKVEDKPELSQTILMKRILTSDNSESVSQLAKHFQVTETVMGKRVKALQDKHGQNFENHPSKR